MGMKFCTNVERNKGAVKIDFGEKQWKILKLVLVLILRKK